MLMVQRRIKNSITTKYEKIECLINYWNKLTGKIMEKAKLKNDYNTVHLLGKIIEVPKPVKFAILRRYIGACRKLHSVAFFQWRLHWRESFGIKDEEGKQ